MKIHRSNLIEALTLAIHNQRHKEVVVGRFAVDSAVLAGWVDLRDAIDNGESLTVYDDTRPLVEQIELHDVQAWVISLVRSDEGYRICDKCNGKIPVSLDYLKHYSGLCLTPDGPASVSPAETCANCHEAIIEGVNSMAPMSMADFHDKGYCTESRYDPIRCQCQGWRGELHLSAHAPDCDGHGNRKVSIAPDTAGKNDLIAEAGHEPERMSPTYTSIQAEQGLLRRHVQEEAILDAMGRGKSLEEKEMKKMKHDPDCDCGICQYCNGDEDVYGNSRRPIPDDTPSLSLLVCDFGGEIVTKFETGELPAKLIPILGKRWGQLFFIDGCSFSGLRQQIDALVGEDDKPAVRIERMPENSYAEYRLILHDDDGLVCPERQTNLTHDDLQGLSRLFGQKAMDDLPIWSPKRGQWTQLYPSGTLSFTITRHKGEVPPPKVSEVPPCTIWRFTIGGV